MAERSRFWDGSTVGDALSITDDELMDRFFRALLNGTGDQGVLAGWLNELEVTDGGGLDAAIDTGGAILYGLFFESDAAETVAVPNNSTVMVIVSRDWATTTTRLTHDGGAGLTQTPGVQYDIPLAEVTTVGGAITVITDARDYCVFSTEPPILSVTTDNIQADAATIAKRVDHTRWISRGAGTLEPDGTNPAAWINTYSYYLSVPSSPYRDSWRFEDAVTDAVWFTLRVPEDITSATMTMHPWLSWLYNPATTGSGNQRWTWNAWLAQPGAVLANQTGNTTFAEAYNWRQTFARRFTLGDLNVTAGDIVHCQISRTGGDVADTSDSPSFLFMVELSYTADG